MRRIGRTKLVGLLAAGMAIGIVMVGTPAGAHVAGWTHNWNQHIKPKADARYWNTNELPWAVVAADGTLYRGNRVDSVTKLGTGIYEVVFKRNVRACAYVASIGLPTGSGNGPAGEINVVGRAGKVKGVFIETHDSAGTNADRGFHLAVHCAGGKVLVAARPLVSDGLN